MSEQRIRDKIEKIRCFLEELETFLPADFETYETNVEKKAACERYFEKVMGAVIDLSSLVLQERGLSAPEEGKEAFTILAVEGIISSPLAARLKDAKGMRNVIAHQYGEVDDKVVFIALTKELSSDVKGFVAAVEKVLWSEGRG